jgi:Zn-finger nucleic acid-binding protein
LSECGKNFAEEQYEGISIDRCTGCDAIYFDAGEVDQAALQRSPRRRVVVHGSRDFMRRKPDGTRLHLVGIQPTILASRTIAGVIGGGDEVLEKALAYILGAIQ